MLACVKDLIDYTFTLSVNLFSLRLRAIFGTVLMLSKKSDKSSKTDHFLQNGSTSGLSDGKAEEPDMTVEPQKKLW